MATLHISLNEPARVHWALVERDPAVLDSAPAPLSADSVLAAGGSATARAALVSEATAGAFAGATVVAVGASRFDAHHARLGLEIRVQIGPLKPQRRYDVHVAAADLADAPNEQTVSTRLPLAAAPEPDPSAADETIVAFCKDPTRGGPSAIRSRRAALDSEGSALTSAGVVDPGFASRRRGAEALFATCAALDAGDPRRRFYSAGGEGETVKGARPAGEPRRPAVRVGTNRLGM